MNDIEDRLRADAAVLAAPRRRRCARGGADGDRSGGRRWLAPALSVAVVLAIAVTLALLSLGGSDRHTCCWENALEHAHASVR